MNRSKTLFPLLCQSRTVSRAGYGTARQKDDFKELIPFFTKWKKM